MAAAAVRTAASGRFGHLQRLILRRQRQLLVCQVAEAVPEVTVARQDHRIRRPWRQKRLVHRQRLRWLSASPRRWIQSQLSVWKLPWNRSLSLKMPVDFLVEIG